MKVLVTGGAGFIGSHLTQRLLGDGNEVVVLDNFATGHRHNLAALDAQVHEADIRDLDACHRACEGVEVVYHQAALGSVPRSVKDPLTTHEVNATGTLNMLTAARDAQVNAFVFAASSSFFGNTKTLPKTDEMPPNPRSPYAVTKVACELYLRVFSELYDLPAVGLRYFNIFGPKQDPNGPYAAVIPKFISQLQAGSVPQIYGDGEQTRDFTFIDNVVEANLQAAKCAPQAKGNVMNVGCGARITLNTLYDLIAAALGSTVRPAYVEPRAGDVRDSLADISLAQNLIGYSPKVNVSEGIQRTVAWFVDHPQRLAAS